jgi:hypothetical protein
MRERRGPVYLASVAAGAIAEGGRGGLERRFVREEAAAVSSASRTVLRAAEVSSSSCSLSDSPSSSWDA